MWRFRARYCMALPSTALAMDVVLLVFNGLRGAGVTGGPEFWHNWEHN